MVGQEMHDEIMHQIALLPSQQSEAIYLRVIEQMPYADVAAALGCDESTARVHIRRAREKLRQTLAHLLPREVCHD
jgi:RNA polymerase sigma-70 factor (ECF subfamily)